MLARKHIHSGIRLAAMLTLIMMSASCDKDPVAPEEEEPSTTQVRLTIGSQTVTFGPQGGTVRITALGATTVSATWLTAAGTADPIANTATFKLQVTPPASGAGSNITFVNSASNSHNGTLTIPTAVTNVPVQFALLHIAENHEDFGPMTVTITAP